MAETRLRDGRLGLRLLAAVSRVTVVHLWALALLLAWFVRREGPSMFRDGAKNPSDRRAMQRPRHAWVLAAAWTEGTRQAGRHVARGARSFLRAWPIEAPTCPVDIRHGVDDVTVPVACAALDAAAMPGAVLHLIPDEGHSVLVNRQEEVHARFVMERGS